MTDDEALVAMELEAMGLFPWPLDTHRVMRRTLCDDAAFLDIRDTERSDADDMVQLDLLRGPGEHAARVRELLTRNRETREREWT